MKKLIVNLENPNGIEVDLTPTEITEKQAREAESLAKHQEAVSAYEQKEADALAGNNKLLELGLTQAQVTAMTGYTPPTEA